MPADTILQSLPPRLAAQVDDYLSAVRSALPDISRSAEVPLSPPIVEVFLTLAAIKRVYAYLRASRWTMDRTLTFLGDHNAHEIAFGARVMTTRSPEVVELRALVDGLAEAISSSGIEAIESASLSDLLRAAAYERPDA